MPIGKLEAYSKRLPYSYAPGMFPAAQCLEYAPERCIRLLLHSKSEGSPGAMRLCRAAERAGVRAETADRVLLRISGKENCFAAAVYEKHEGVFDEKAPHIVLVNPGDGGNLGTILRTALGFGFCNVAIIRPAADSDDPHVVRASMGALFALHVRHFDSFDAYREAFADRTLFPFMLTGSVTLGEAVARAHEPFSLVFGNEATGLGEAFASLGVPTRIVHSDRIDSLNLAVAAGIGMCAFAGVISKEQASNIVEGCKL